jgi:glycosyltransferase involved in cell wall biosynthesis
MRIGLITGEYPPMQGGVGHFSQQLRDALAALGHDLHIYTDAQVPSQAAITGAARNWNRACLGQVQAWAARHQLDVLNIQYQAAAFGMSGAILALPRLVRLPVVSTFHDLLPPYLFPKAGPARRWAVTQLARGSAASVVTNSQDEAALSQRLAKTGGIIKRIPIGSNIAKQPPNGYDRAAWRASLNIPAGATLAGYFGFINHSKGLEILLQACAQAISAGLDVYLLLIGGRTGESDRSNAGQASAIDQLIGELGLSGRVRQTGYVESEAVSANLLACDFLALPYSDGLSFRRGSFMAGLAHGCAIISTVPQVPLPDVVEGQHVRLVPAADPAALAGAMRQLAADAGLRARLGQGAAQLSQLFGWESIARQTVAVYQEACRRG